MKIQRFRARSAHEALEQARIALGPEALILQTRRVPATGIERLLGRPQVEVLAAIDTAPNGREGPGPSIPGPLSRRGGEHPLATAKRVENSPIDRPPQIERRAGVTTA